MVRKMKFIVPIICLLFCCIRIDAFTALSVTQPINKYHATTTNIFSEVPSDVTEDTLNETSISLSLEIEQIKLELLKLCASYDRGYGATPRSREQVNTLIKKLEVLNPTQNASRGVDGKYAGEATPLKGIWRMVWTTALDVLNLSSNPLAGPGAIYQKIDPPIATNIIDFIPRFQTLFPTEFPSTLLRAEVQTRASTRSGYANRVGLDFEAVKLLPVEVLGVKAVGALPPLNFNLPRIKTSDLPGVNPDNAPGFFDVVYLDEDMLIIKQNAPGGVFVSIKVPDCEP